MFSERTNLYRQRLSVRLAFFFSLLFVLSASSSFGVIYVVLSRYLARSDQGIIEAKWDEYRTLLRHAGLPELRTQVDAERFQEGDVPLLVEVFDPSGKILYLKLPSDVVTLQSEVEKRLSPLGISNGWGSIRSPHEGDKIDILTRTLEPGGRILRVGKSSDPRDDILEYLSSIFLLICFVSLAVGASLGTYFSHRALLPLRNLVSTIREVHRGSLSSRVPESATGDEMEELTRIFNAMLDRVQKLVRGMHDTLDNVAHDIRTPMARIRAIAELRLRSEPGADDRSALEECAESADEIVTLLSSVLELAEVESGTLPLHFETVTLSSLIQPVVELYELVAEEKLIRIIVENPENPSVRVDAPKMKQALSNILDNAIKYSTSNSDVRIAVATDRDRVYLSIYDHGPGIPEEDIERIWDRLFRGDKSRSQKGLGIGLSIVRALVHAHGGTVRVENGKNGGSIFTVELLRPIM